MAFAIRTKSEGLLGAAIVSSVLMVCIAAAVMFSKSSPGTSLSSSMATEKYPATAFVVKRQGRLKSKTSYVGIAAGAGISVDMEFDKSEQKLSLKIKDRLGEPLSRVTIDAQARKVGKTPNSKRIAMKEYSDGEYRSDPMSLGKGGWILMVSAYDLFDRNDNKLLFHTEQPVFFK